MLAEERSELHRFRNECLSAVHTYHTATTTNSGSSTSGGLTGSSSSSSSSGVDDSGSGAENSHPWGAFRKKLAAAPASTGSGSSTSTSPTASQPVIHWPQLTTSSSSSAPSVTGTAIGSASRTTANHGEAVVGSVDEGDDGARETGTVHDDSLVESAAVSCCDFKYPLLTHLAYSILYFSSSTNTTFLLNAWIPLPHLPR